MSETAAALLALARHFEFKASIEQYGPGAVAAWAHAAEAARDAAAEYEDNAADPGPIPVGPVFGGEHRGILRAVTEGDG